MYLSFIKVRSVMNPQSNFPPNYPVYEISPVVGSDLKTATTKLESHPTLETRRQIEEPRGKKVRFKIDIILEKRIGWFL